MAGGEAARVGEDGEAGPGAGIVALAGEIGGERVARLGQLRRAVRPRAWAPISAAEAWPSAQAFTSCPSAATRPSPSSDEVDDDPAAADRRALLDARLRRPPAGAGCGIDAARRRMSRV